MSNAKLCKSWIVDDEKSNVYNKTLLFMEKRRMAIAEKSQKSISAKQGSLQITRLLGSFLTPAIYLPKTITIEFEELETGTKITLHIMEDIGLSEDSKLKYKYNNFFSAWLDDYNNYLNELQSNTY
ncbi:hypothetical protein [Tindallia californiensis]|uniref:Uncharacterized protein n=1 Tax=Tindallia californiensis TaxID=159292 RepID=A0A1H3QRF8_9FIRM|nr:hypothetical protein [Tindallia californiensis]SDZ15269.1 hypothetical protein SAMN05192546_11035 [Tindallia californiensis]